MTKQVIRRIVRLLPIGPLLAALLCGCGAADTAAGWRPDPSDVPGGEHTSREVTVRDGDMALTVAEDTLALTLTKGQCTWTDGGASDLLRLRFYDRGGTEYNFGAVRDCVSYGQYAVAEQDGQIRIDMLLGKAESSTVLPQIVRRAVFEELLGRVNDRRGSKMLQNYYQLTERNGAEVYVLNDYLSDAERSRLEGYLRDAGCTAETVQQEYQALGYTKQQSSTPLFCVRLWLGLSDGGMTAEVKLDSLKYDTDTYILNRITLLPGLQQAQIPSDNSVFLPDGCGALIRLSEDDPAFASSTRRVYGNDDAADTELSPEDYLAPVYGICDGQAAMMTVIEDGAALCEITTERQDGGVAVYTSLIYQDYASIKMASSGGDQAALNRYSSSRPACSYRLRYQPLSGDRSYVGMAKAYRTYLEERGLLPQQDGQGAFATEIETLGSVLTDDRVLMFDIRRAHALTTFAQDRQIADEWQQLTGRPVRLLLTGIGKNGLSPVTAKKIGAAAILGGRSGLSALTAAADADDRLTLFIAADMQQVADTAGFSRRTSAARRIDDHYVDLGSRNIATGNVLAKNFCYGVSPVQLPALFTAGQKRLAALSADHVLYTDLAARLYSDPHTNTDRAAALEAIEGCLKAASGTVSVRKGYAYSWPYATSISGLPTSTSGDLGYDEEVPFMQIVLRGKIAYYSSALNLEDDLDRAVLRCIETGTLPHFVFAAQNDEQLTRSGSSEYYSVGWSYGKARAAEAANKIRTALQGLDGQPIVGHSRLSATLVRTDFAGGSVLINYGDSAQTVDGIEVPAMGYARADGN